MTKSPLTIAGGLALLLASATGAQAAGAAGTAKGFSNTQANSIVERVHSIYEAQHKLHYLGYYAIRTERASLPYSFVACKRGQRYHIHIDDYGDLVQVDDAGSCQDHGQDYGQHYGARDYERQPRYENRDRYSGYNRYRRDDDY